MSEFEAKYRKNFKAVIHMKVFAKSRDNKVIHFGIVAKYFLFE
jgi:hypothetical protein